MKNNYISLKDKNGNKFNYRILFNIECSESKKNYIIYTDDKKDKYGQMNAFISSYELSDKGNMTKLKRITNEKDIEFITKILNSLQK